MGCTSSICPADIKDVRNIESPVEESPQQQTTSEPDGTVSSNGDGMQFVGLYDNSFLLGSDSSPHVHVEDSIPLDDSDLDLPPVISGGLTTPLKEHSKYVAGELYPARDTDALPSGALVIGMDFGTSRTAYAYSFVGRDEDIRVRPPANSVLTTATQLKAETCVVLDGSKKAIGFGLKGRENMYVQQQDRHDLHLFQWFKMNLQHVRSDDELVMVKDHRGQEVSLLTVVTEALAYVASSALQDVAALGRPYTTHDVHWVITVPAIWTAAAAGFMRRAAFKANLIPNQLSRNLTLVKEPEGASLLMMQLIEKNLLNVDLIVGSEIVVLDIGGGTNDMTFIRIVSTSPVRCVEIRAPSGGSHGAIKIDAKLEQLLECIFTPECYRKMKSGSASSVDVIRLFEVWENFKMGFEGKNPLHLNLGSLMMNWGITKDVLHSATEKYNRRCKLGECIKVAGNATITLPAALIRKWFNEVISGICTDFYINLMDSSCQNIKFVHLVGGFSANAYVNSRLMQFNNNNKYLAFRKLKMFGSDQPDFAIVRGAVLASMVNFISHRVAKYSYGIEICEPFNSTIHEENKKIWIHKKAYVKVFLMFVKQGDYIPTAFVTNGQDIFPLSPSQRKVIVSLFIVDDEDISSKRTLGAFIDPGDKDVSSKKTLYTSDSKVVKHASVDVPLRSRGEAVNVSLKFGSEIQIIVKDKKGEPFPTATCVQYACSAV